MARVWEVTKRTLQSSDDDQMTHHAAALADYSLIWGQANRRPIVNARLPSMPGDGRRATGRVMLRFQRGLGLNEGAP